MSGAAATAGAVCAASADSRDSREAWAPLLLGACGGALVAGRFETVALCIAVAAAAALALSARVPRARWIGMLAISMTTAVLLNLYLVAGHPLPLPRVLGAPATREGLRYGALLALRILGAALSVHALSALWPGERAADRLAGLMKPLERWSVPVDEGRTVLGLALRFVPLLGTESARIARLQTFRAGRPPRTFRERVTRLRARVVPSLVAALERAEQVSLVLEARHHRGAAIAAVRRPIAAWLAGAVVMGTALLWRS